MTNEPDGAYDWPHAVGAESKAELIAEITRLRDELADFGEEMGREERKWRETNVEIARLRGLLEAAQSCFRHYLKAGYLSPLSAIEAEDWLAAYDKLKGE